MTQAPDNTADPLGFENDEDDEVADPNVLVFYLTEMKDLVSVGFQTFFYIFRGKREKGAIAQQCFEIGNQSMFFMAVTMAFIGAIVAFQMGLQASKIIPDMSLLGAMYIKLLIRDIAASVGAMPLATRVGAGIAAQIGSMVVTEQTDALRMSAADPVDYLLVPRFIACTVMGTSVLIIGGVVAYVAGGVVMYLTYDVNPNTYVDFRQLNWGDCILGLLKCVSYGGTIALVSGQRGLRTFGGSEGVGTATTQAVVGSLFAVMMVTLFLSIVGFFFLPA